jgi:hypothetical protein
MARFIVHNKSTSQIQLLVPTSHNSAAFLVPPSGSINILPWVGSMEACRHIGQIRILKSRGLVDVIEEP